jgi:hypothetical protein
MTLIEKLLLAVLIVGVVIVGGLTAHIGGMIHEAGGLRSAVIEAGRDIKDISDEIQNEQ